VVSNGTVTAGTISTPIITDGSGRTLSLTDLIAELYPLPVKYTNVFLADTLNARGFEVDLSRFVTNGYDCRLDFHLQHETTDLVVSTSLTVSFEESNLGTANVTGLQLKIHGFALDGEVYGYGDHTLDTAAKATIAIISGSWAGIYNYKKADFFGVVRDSNGAIISADSATYTGADRYKVFVVFHPLVSGRLTVRKQ
jgi:hypothetical protein